MDIEALLVQARDNSPKAQFEVYGYYAERSGKATVGAAEREKCIYEMEFWLRKAAFNGLAEAQLELAKAEYDLYSELKNDPAETDYNKLAFIAGECIYWYRQAIGRGYAPAVERLDYVNAFEKSVAEFKERKGVAEKNPYEDLFYNEAPLAYFAGRQRVGAAETDDDDYADDEQSSHKTLIVVIAVIAALAVGLGIGAALFKDDIKRAISPETTTVTQAPTTVIPINEATTASAAPQTEKSGVVDDANLFSAAEKSALQTKINAIVEKYKFDVVLHTTLDIGDSDVRTYAVNYYDSNGYGISENRDGLIFMLNMDSREYYTATSGYGVAAFTSSGIKEAGSAMSADLSSGKYFDAFSTYLEYVDKILSSYQNGEPYEGTTQQPVTVEASVSVQVTTAAQSGRSGTVNTQSDPLNIRKEPLASSDKLGQFAKGAVVTVEGDAITDSSGAKWYRCTGVDTNGSQVTGYCNANFITIQ